MTAETMMAALNANAARGIENGKHVFLEDVQSPDGQWFRLEYHSQPDGTRASAWLRYNPLKTNKYSYEQSHLSDKGWLCLGTEGDSKKDDSPYDLEFVVKRARFWVIGFCYLMEHGYEATCRDMPEWRSPER